MNKYDNADVCEEAHKRTVIACRKLKIKVDDVKNEELNYTPKAQIIFDKHFDEVEGEFEQNLIDLQKAS